MTSASVRCAVGVLGRRIDASAGSDDPAWRICSEESGREMARNVKGERGEEGSRYLSDNRL